MKIARLVVLASVMAAGLAIAPAALAVSTVPVTVHLQDPNGAMLEVDITSSDGNSTWNLGTNQTEDVPLSMPPGDYSAVQKVNGTQTNSGSFTVPDSGSFEITFATDAPSPSTPGHLVLRVHDTNHRRLTVALKQHGNVLWRKVFTASARTRFKLAPGVYALVMHERHVASRLAFNLQAGETEVARVTS